ncbi:hypothetical protein N665_1911s0008 [Sinapis alba]|nr:hypothetical protein N665_1911s0008 [Sinapis alba]
MSKKKTTQSFLPLSLVLILLCVSLHVGVTEAIYRHLGVGAAKWTKKISVGPSPPCGAPPAKAKPPPSKANPPPYKKPPTKPCRLVPPRPPRLH